MVAEREIPARQCTRTRALEALAFSETQTQVGLLDSYGRWRSDDVTEEEHTLTNELHRSVQPRQDLLTERVVDRNSQEVRLGDEVRFGTRVAGVQDVTDVVLLHQVLKTETRAGSEQTNSALLF